MKKKIGFSAEDIDNNVKIQIVEECKALSSTTDIININSLAFYNCKNSNFNFINKGDVNVNCLLIGLQKKILYDENSTSIVKDEFKIKLKIIYFFYFFILILIISFVLSFTYKLIYIVRFN